MRALATPTFQLPPWAQGFLPPREVSFTEQGLKSAASPQHAICGLQLSCLSVSWKEKTDCQGGFVQVAGNAAVRRRLLAGRLRLWVPLSRASGPGGHFQKAFLFPLCK